MRPVLLPAVLWGQARPRLPWSLTIPAWCSYIRQKNRWSMPKDAIGNISYAPRRGHESCVVTTPAGHVGNKDDKGADREAGTRSRANLICLPSVVTPHLRCAFHQCTGDFLLLLGLIGFAFTLRLSHKILQMLQPSEMQQQEQQRLLMNAKAKGCGCSVLKMIGCRRGASSALLEGAGVWQSDV